MTTPPIQMTEQEARDWITAIDQSRESAIQTDKQTATPSQWETFSDVAYFDMWCVRRKGEREFGKGFHVVNRESALSLIAALDARDAKQAERDKRIGELEAAGNRLSRAAQTSGGTSGRDEEIIAAISAWSVVL